jgi:hypothetical protein
MNRNLLIITFIAILIVISFESCDSCHTDYLGKYKFTGTDLSIVPYLENETIIFKDSTGDSLPFYCSGRSSYEQQYYQANSNDDECPLATYYADVHDVRFTGQTNALHFILSFSNITHPPVRKIIGITLSYTRDQKYGFDCFFEFDNLNLIDINESSDLYYSDSISIGPKKFYNVYTLEQYYSFNENLQYLYYSSSIGIVGFCTDTGHYWYLSQ